MCIVYVDPILLDMSSTAISRMRSESSIAISRTGCHQSHLGVHKDGPSLSVCPGWAFFNPFFVGTWSMYF